MSKRKQYPSDRKDEEWAFNAPYLTLMTEDAPQRLQKLRDVFDVLKWVVKSGSPWRYLAGDFPRWEAVYQLSRRWLRGGVFEAMTNDLRAILGLGQGRQAHPSAAMMDGGVLQSSAESGARAGYDGHKRKSGSKVHAAVETLGHLVALEVTPANEQERAQVAELAENVQQVTGEKVELALVEQGDTGETALGAAAEQGIRLVVVKHEQAKKGFVLQAKSWVVERSFAWKSRFRRLARDFERLPDVLAGLHVVAFSCLLLNRLRPLLTLTASA